jgi:hypothetical protein
MRKNDSASNGNAAAIECDVAIQPTIAGASAPPPTAKGEGRAHRGPPDLRWEQLGVVAEPAAKAAGDQKIQHQSHPEQACGTIELSNDDKKDITRSKRGLSRTPSRTHSTNSAGKMPSQ